MKFSIAIFTLLGFGFLMPPAEAKTNTVVDLSHHNGKVNLAKAKAAGITTVIHKATQGTTYVDPKYVENKEAAEKLGLTWAAYHFATGADGTKQAEHFIKHAGKVKRYVIDLEENPNGTQVGKKQAEDLAKAIESKTGQLPIVYGAPSFLNSLNSQVLARCPLWLANYRSWKNSGLLSDEAMKIAAYMNGLGKLCNSLSAMTVLLPRLPRLGVSIFNETKSDPVLPKGWSSWLMWQYTDGTAGPQPHTVNGIGKVDRSYLNGSL